MSSIERVNGVLTIVCSDYTETSNGALTSGQIQLRAFGGESFNHYNCDPESTVIVTAGNQWIEGDKVNMIGDVQEGIGNIYLETTNSQGTFSGDEYYITFSDDAEYNNIKTIANASHINYGNSHYNTVEAVTGSNTWQTGKDSYGNISILGNQYDVVYANGSHNMFIGDMGTKVYNIEDGANRTVIIGGTSGNETINDYAGSKSQGGYTLYIGNGANSELNLYGTRFTGNTTKNESNNTNYYSARYSYVFNGQTGTDHYGNVYDYKATLEKHNWSAETFAGATGVNFKQDSYIYDLFQQEIKPHLR